MKERLLEFLKAENKSSAQLAEEIGVQPSGISHILSGRNNPSLDFILKMLEKYPFLSSEWVLFGKGSMYNDPKMQTLFDQTADLNTEKDIELISNDASKSEIRSKDVSKVGHRKDFDDQALNNAPVVEKIVLFYNNNRFEEYFPRH
jgi:transcriptional regulator with XRE-family HTH domain